MRCTSLTATPFSRTLVGAAIGAFALTGCNANVDAPQTKHDDEDVVAQVASAVTSTYYDFEANASNAAWGNNDGGLVWGTNDGRGACRTTSGAMENGSSYSYLLTQPKSVASGAIQGAYTVTVPASSLHPTLTATFGFTQGASSTDGATFSIKTQVNGAWVTLLTAQKNYTGALSTVSVAIPSAYTGQTLQLVLGVNAGASATNDRAAWTDVRLVADAGGVPNGGCTISGVNYEKGAVNPTLSCQVCEPNTSTSAWSIRGDSCLIGGTCYSENTPGLWCNTCDPSVSQTNWSNDATCAKVVVGVTNKEYFGDFGGIAQADSACASEGANSGLSGTWRAMVAKSGTREYKDAVPSEFASLPVVNLHGEQMYASWNGIFTNQVWPSGRSLYTFPNAPGMGQSPNDCFNCAYTGTVWTGAGTNGLWLANADKNNCDYWTSQGYNFNIFSWHAYNAAVGDFAQRKLVNGGYTDSDSITGCGYKKRFACALVLLPAATPTSLKVTVTTHEGNPLGTVQGFAEGNVYTYLGIPYAKAPIGSNRFAPPKAPDPKPVLDGTKWAPVCLQAPLADTGVTVGSEDCLYLNIWAPKSGTNHPVIVYHHGGGLLFGGAPVETVLDTTTPLGAPTPQQSLGWGINSGASFADRQDAVFVSIQTRLGALGYLAHSALSADASSQTSPGTSGNYGLLDAIQALKWVKKNISQFGGNPNKVTLWGYSGGASLVSMLVASPLARDGGVPLFSSAILESGFYEQPAMSPGVASTVHVPAGGTTRYDQAASVMATLTANCTDPSTTLKCLRSAPLINFVNAAGAGSALKIFPPLFNNPISREMMWGLPFGPGIDGYVLPDQPRWVIAAGNHNKVPVILGSNEDEGNTFMILMGVEWTLSGLVNFNPMKLFNFPSCADRDARLQTNLVTAATGVGARLTTADMATITSYYPCSTWPVSSAIRNFLKPTLSYSRGVTHVQYECPARRLARALTKGQPGVPVRRYRWTHSSDTPGVFQNLLWLVPEVGAAHALDELYKLNTFGTVAYLPSPRERTMGAAVMKYYGAFAASGDPNYSGSPVSWPVYNVTSDPLLNVKIGIDVQSNVDKTQCDFWDEKFTLDGWK